MDVIEDGPQHQWRPQSPTVKSGEMLLRRVHFSTLKFLCNKSAEKEDI